MKPRLLSMTLVTVTWAILQGAVFAQGPRGPAKPAAYFVGDTGSAQGYVHPSMGPLPYSVGDSVRPATHFAGSHAFFVGDAPPAIAAGHGAPCDSCGCGGGGCGSCCDDCGPKMWGSVEYMMAWTKGRLLPPLVTTATGGGIGQIGDPDTVVLFGDGDVGTGLQAGGRLDLGYWIKRDQSLGVGGRIWGLEGDSTVFNASTDTFPVLAVPFFNVDPILVVPSEFVIQLGDPTTGRTGGVEVRATNDVVSTDLYLRSLLDAGCSYRLDLIGGYNFARIDDDVQLSATTNIGGAQGTTFSWRDQFAVKNSYHAGEFGLLGEVQRGRFTLGGLTKLSLGTMTNRIAIRGQTATTVAGVTTVTNGGVFALGANLGDFESDKFVYSPEAGVKLSYALTDGMSLSVGYTFSYWSSVVLAGDLIDRTINASQIGGNVPILPPDRPALTIRDTDFWVQSVNFGFNWVY